MFDFFLIWKFNIFMTFLFVAFRPFLKGGHLIHDVMQLCFHAVFKDCKPFLSWKNMELVIFP